MDTPNVISPIPEWAIKKLAESGITSEQADKLKFRTVKPADANRLLGFGNANWPDAFVIPFFDPETGKPMLTPDGREFVRLRMEKPVEMPTGKPAKYLSPRNGSQHAYILPEVHQYLVDNPSVPVLLTEGELKAICATLRGVHMIGLPGIDGFTGKDNRLLPELVRYATAGRDFYMIHDSDAKDPKKQKDFDAAAGRFAAALVEYGCALRRVILPPLVRGEKAGVDDLLVAGDWTAEKLCGYINTTAERVLGCGAIPELIPLSQLTSIPDTGDPNELLKHRFLCRGGALQFVSQAGLGKSSFILQAAVTWARGKSMFGIEPARPLRSWIIQAENDAGDLAEERDGVRAGMIEEGQGTESELAAAFDAVFIATVDSVTGEAFHQMLDGMLLAAGDAKPDLVFIDPLLAYIGGDVSKQEVASKFLRNGLNPVIHKHGIGLVIVHHTTKPPKAELRAARNGDGAYSGSGSAELANWARAVLSIEPLQGSDTVYCLVAGKRGRRLGWQDKNGNPTNKKFIAHSPVPGRICWVTPDAADIPEQADPVKPGKKVKTVKQLADQAFEIIAHSGDKWMRLQSFKAEVESRLGIGRDRQEKTTALLLEENRLAKRKIRTNEQYDIIGLPDAVETFAKETTRIHQNPTLPNQNPHSRIP